MEKKQLVFLMIPPIFRCRKLPYNNIYKLFQHPENIAYIKHQIVCEIEDLEEASATHILSQMIRDYPKHLDFVEGSIRRQKIYDDGLPLKERLHNQNVMMIFKTARIIYDTPSMLDDNFNRLNEFGEVEFGEYQHTAYSFRGGQWHPEDIFLESAANRGKSYWKPMSVSIDPSKRGLGNHWTDEVNPYPFNPYQVYKNHFAPLERSRCDSVVETPRRLPY